MALIYTNTSSRNTKKAKKAQARSKEALRLQNAELEKKYRSTYSNTNHLPGRKLSSILTPIVNKPYVREVTRHPSLDTGTGSTALRPRKEYTGTEMIGIGQLHKSNAIPIFKKSDAEDLAKMRRS